MRAIRIWVFGQAASAIPADSNQFRLTNPSGYMLYCSCFRHEITWNNLRREKEKGTATMSGLMMVIAVSFAVLAAVENLRPDGYMIFR